MKKNTLILLFFLGILISVGLTYVSSRIWLAGSVAIWTDKVEVSTTVTGILNETDPLWTANFTLYNESWSSCYNATYEAKTMLVNKTYCSGTSCVISGIQSGDIMFVFAKGDLTGTSSTVTISLNRGGSAVDQVVHNQAYSSERVPFSLIYYGLASSTSHTFTVTTTGGTLGNVKIMIEVFR